MCQEVGRVYAHASEGVDGREGRAMDGDAIRARSKEWCVSSFMTYRCVLDKPVIIPRGGSAFDAPRCWVEV